MQQKQTNFRDTTHEILSKLIWIEEALRENVTAPEVATYNANTLEPATGRETDGDYDDGGGGGKPSRTAAAGVTWDDEPGMRVDQTDAGTPRVRRVSSPMDAEDIVTIPKIVENTERLAYALDLLREDAAHDQQRRAGAIQLATNVRWFLADVKKCDGDDGQQLDVLLARYDRYLKAYYRLRYRESEAGPEEASGGGGGGGGADVAGPERDEPIVGGDPVCSETPSRPHGNRTEGASGNPDDRCGADRDGHPSAGGRVVSMPDGCSGRKVRPTCHHKGSCTVHRLCCCRCVKKSRATVTLLDNKHSGLYACPGLLDVTKDRTCLHGLGELAPDGPTDDEAKCNGNPVNWLSEVVTYCCSCLPLKRNFRNRSVFPLVK